MDKARKPRLIDQLPPVVRRGGWVDIGHDSKIRLSGRTLLHRCNGVTSRYGLRWLVLDRPLLNYALHKCEIGVDAACQPA